MQELLVLNIASRHLQLTFRDMLCDSLNMEK